jgi:hypothetical protein
MPAFIAHLVLSVFYHAGRNKEKCDLRGGGGQIFAEWEGQKQPEIELNGASIRSYTMSPSYQCPSEFPSGIVP